MKIIIWGLGERGKRIYSKIKDMVIAFIESDASKVGSFYDGKMVIDIEEYSKSYSQYYILISPLKDQEIEAELKRRGLEHFFSLKKAPIALQRCNDNTLIDNLIQEFNVNNDYAIYGTEFWSVYLYFRLLKKGCKKLQLIPTIGDDLKKLDGFQESFPFVQISCMEECRASVYISTVINGKQEINEIRMGANAKIVEAFDDIFILDEDKNARLEEFKDIHKGERCFIIATGPSLTMQDLDLLQARNERTIGMNRGYLAFDRSKWRPDYYVVEDKKCIEESGDVLKNMPLKGVFLSDTYKKFWDIESPLNVYRYHSREVIVDKRIQFSDDISRCIYAYATVTYSCIQLAVYMGFKEIFLLGLDFNFSTNYKDKGNHFDTRYYSDSSKVDKFWKEESITAYETAKRYADSHGIKIYNATRGGNLEVFERREFDTLFESGKEYDN